MPKPTSCGVLVRSQDKYLIAHATQQSLVVSETDGCWSIPKGMQDPNETELETALREFREETGYDLTANNIPVKYIGVVKSPNKNYVVFLANDSSGKMQSVEFVCNSLIDHHRVAGLFGEPEIDGYLWKSLEECKNMAFDSLKPIFELDGIV